MDDIMISALQHYAYCPRQCALIHLEQVFEENEFTMRGNISHQRVHIENETTDGSTSMTLWSDQYGLIGKSDQIEWQKDQPKPVEYKYGRINKTTKLPDEVQLCAQVLCLEEMFQIQVPEADIFYVSSRKRESVKMTNQLRQKTLEIIEQTRQMLVNKVLPKPVNDARCSNCSLNEICMPEISLTAGWKNEWRKALGNGTVT